MWVIKHMIMTTMLTYGCKEIMEKRRMNKIKLDNSHIGTIGENLVVTKLMQNGWDALNINNSIKNYKGADILCVDNENGKMSLVQVKTGRGKSPNFITGLISDNNGNIERLEEKIIGPWVFVHVKNEGTNLSDYDFYVLTRKETIKIIRTSNDWYVKEYVREKELSNNTVVGLKLIWLQGEGEQDTMNNQSRHHPAYINPLGHNAKDRWDKIFSGE